MIPEAARAALEGYATAARMAVAPYLDVIRLVASLAVVIATVVLVWRIHAWRDGYLERDAAVAARDAALEELQGYKAASTAAAVAYTDRIRENEATIAAERKTAEDHERDLQNRIPAAAAAGRDLAGRLRDYQVRRCGGPVPAAAGAPAQPPDAAQEPGDGARVERLTAAHLEACAADAEQLRGWQQWWTDVKAGRAAQPNTVQIGTPAASTRPEER